MVSMHDASTCVWFCRLWGNFKKHKQMYARHPTKVWPYNQWYCKL